MTTSWGPAMMNEPKRTYLVY